MELPDISAGVALDALRKHLAGDVELQWTYHSAIAISFLEVSVCLINPVRGASAHELANRGAAQSMKELFGVDTTTHPKFVELAGKWRAARETKRCAYLAGELLNTSSTIGTR